MVARRDFLIPVHVGRLVPILFADDSLCHAFTPSVTSYHTPPTGDHKGPPWVPSSAIAWPGQGNGIPPRAATRAPTLPNSSPAPMRDPSHGHFLFLLLLRLMDIGGYTAISSLVSSRSGREVGVGVGAVITWMWCCSIASRLSLEMSLSVISVSRSSRVAKRAR